MMRAYAYTRVSTDIQIEGYSLEAQENTINRYANGNDIKIIKTFSDKGKSGKNISGRLEFQKMLEAAKKGEDNVTTILVFKLSRFGRNAADVLSTVQDLKNYGINLICIEEGIDSSKDAGKLMLALLSSVAEMERENIAVQTMAGRRQKALDGKWNGGQAPYGYKIGKDGVLEIEPEEAKLVKLIFDSYTRSNLGYTGVTKILYDKGIKRIPRGNGKLTVFKEASIRKILSNPVYCGKIRYGKTKTEKIKGKNEEYQRVESDDYIFVDGKHKAIISEETYNTAQEKMQENKKRNAKTHDKEHETIFSTIVKCPICGASMYGNVSRKKKPDGTMYKNYYFYQCKRRMKVSDTPCSYKTHIPQDLLDNAVFEVLYKIMAEKNYAYEMRNILNKDFDVNSIIDEVTNCERHISSLMTAKERILTRLNDIDYLSPVAEIQEADLQKRLEDCYQKINEAQKAHKECKKKLTAAKQQQISVEQTMKMLSEFGGRFQAMTDSQKKEVVNATFKRIDIFPDYKERGQLLRSMELLLPMYWNGELTKRISLDKDNDDETVVLLSKKR